MLQGRYCSEGWWLLLDGEVLSVSRNAVPEYDCKQTLRALQKAYSTQLALVDPAKEGGIFPDGVENMPKMPEVAKKAAPKAEIVWKDCFATGGDGVRRKTHTEGTYEQGGVRFAFRIASLGGSMTVKRYWLTVYDTSHPAEDEFMQVRFHKLAAAKAWARDYMADGAVLNYSMMQTLYT